ncbi:hypothetical protein IKG68_00210 [Candidatus Saccharibacteria bacterium]|nr:hypothetical protein [Candidatus Saccharibacteria bacterium]
MPKVIQNKLTKLLTGRVTGPALRPALLIIPFLAILSFLYINIYVETALRSSSAISDSQSHQVVVSDATNLTISFLDDSGTATTSPTNIDVTPSAAGVFNSGDVTIDVSTNYDYGYTLTMSASTSSLSRSEAVGDRTYEIPTLLASKDDNNNPYTCTPATSTSCNFPKNYWGLKRTSAAITDAGYIPMIPNYNMPVTTTDAGADSSTSTVTVGVKLSNETPYGLYTIDMNFLAVANLAPSTAYMQDATPSSLAYLMPNVGDSTVLYDKRDNQEYTVAKLADGKYWMTKNLNLAGGTVLTSDDTDMAPSYTMPTTYVDPDSGTTLPTGFGEGNVLPASSKTGFDNDYKAFIYNTGNNTDTCTGDGCYSYYSYNAATLGSGMGISSDNTDAPYSVCPKGWKLPASRLTLELAKTSSDFYQMAIHYGLNPADVNETSDAAPTFCTSAGDCPGAPSIPRFLRAGNYNGSTLYLGGTDGYYWSSTANSSRDARHLYFYSGGVYSTVNNPRRYGFSVRCLFDDTMQSFSSDYADSLAMEESVQLRDKRDNKQYWVTKLKDGNVWMTQNLDFDITGPLDSTTTNLTVSGTAPYVTGYTKDNTTGIITWTPSATTISAPAINQSFTWSNNDNNPQSVDLGDWYYRSDYYNNDDCDEQGCNYHTGNAGSQFSQTPSANGAHSHAGNYYNWSAAVASSNTNGYNSGNAANSLCPANWNLPVDGMYGTLNTIYNNGLEGAQTGGNADKNLLAAPLYFVRAGFVWSSALRNAGRDGYYWFSTVYSSSLARRLLFLSSSVRPTGGDYRGRGMSLRCVLRGNQ